MKNVHVFQTVRLAALAAVISCAGCTKHAREARYLAAAARAASEEKFDEAELQYRLALKLVPDDAIALQGLGNVYYVEGRGPDSYIYLKTAAKSDPKNIELAIKVANLEFSGGQLEQARAAAKQAVGTDPKNVDALMLLVGTSVTRADIEESRKLIAAIQIKHGDLAQYHLARGTLHMTLREFPAAEQELNAALRLDPRSPLINAQLGDLKLAQGDVEAARRSYLAAVNLSPWRSPVRLKYAEFELRAGDAAVAKRTIEQINLKAPDYIPAWILAMKIAFQERRYADCDAIVQKILARDGLNYDALLENGNLKIARVDSEGAVASFEQLDRVLRGKSAEVKYRLALAYIQHGDPQRARTNLQQALVLAPRFEQATLLLAEVNTRSGDPRSAIASLTQLMNGSAVTGQGYLLLARAYQADNNAEQAIAVYQRVEKAFPKDPQIPYLIGALLLGQGRTADGRGALERSLSIKPDYGSALDVLINSLLVERQFDAASTRVAAVERRYPASPIPWLLRAKIHYAQQNLTASETDLLKAIGLDPRSQAGYMLLARVYLAMNNRTQAITKLKAFAATTNNVTALMEIGILHSEVKEYKEAAAAYRQALAIDPQFSPALNNLAYLESEQFNNVDEAEKLARKARRVNPEDPYSADTLGWVLFHKRQFPAALTQIQEAADGNPTDPEVQFHLGMVHYMLGNEESALAAFKCALDSGQTFEGLGETKDRLAILNATVSSAGTPLKFALEARLRIQPDDPFANGRLGELRAAAGDYKGAAENFEAALKVARRDQRTLMDLARLYAGPLSQIPRALDLAKLAHEISPNDADISLMLGRLLLLSGDYKWSVNLLEAASRAFPDRTDVLLDLARGYGATSRNALASSTLQTLRSLAPRPPISTQMERLGRFLGVITPAAAMPYVTEAAEIRPDDPDHVFASVVLALADEQRANYSAAAGRYQAVLAADPFLLMPAQRLGIMCLRHLNQPKVAQDVSRKALMNFPGDSILCYIQGRALLEQKQYAEASRYLRQSLVGEPSNSITLLALAMCQENLGDKKGSVKSYEAAMRAGLSDGEMVVAREALARLMPAGNGTTGTKR